MRLGDVVGRARALVTKRGGTKALQEDAKELKEIAGRKGSAADKAKRAAEALKDPGAPGDSRARRDPGAARRDP